MTIALLSAVIVVLLVDRFFLQPVETSTVMNPTAPDSIAVLPFANLSDNPANEYFADGLAEELLNLLAQVDGLKVSARTSSFYFKDRNPTIEEVAEALDVDTVLAGSVRRSGDTIRVVVQLIAADDSANLWSQRYDRPLTELFAVQDDIANQIVAAMMPHLQGPDRPAIVTDTGVIEATDFARFMLARQRYYDDSRESMAVAKNEFLAVTEAAPGYAPAWAWLARSWIAPGGREDVTAEDAERLAQEAIDNALAIDSKQPMAFVARGDLAYEKGLNDSAITNYDRAIALNNDLVDAHIRRNLALSNIGQPEAAIEALIKARAIDPLHPEVLEELAHLLNLQGERAAALEAVETLWLVNATAAVSVEAHLYSDSGQKARSLYVAEEFGNEVVKQTEYWPVSLAVGGRREEALSELEKVKNGTSSAHFRADLEYQVLEILGDSATALRMLKERGMRPDAAELGIDLDMPDMLMLAGLMIKHDDTEYIKLVLRPIGEIAGAFSETHSGIYHWLNGYYELLAGNVEEGAEHFQVLADRGDAGVGYYGNATLIPWLFEGDERLETIHEQFVENQRTQVEELRRMRNSNLTLEQVRAEYIAEGN
jgi:TolB-like protein